jgi:PAS domain S-box-containing protein
VAVVTVLADPIRRRVGAVTVIGAALAAAVVAGFADPGRVLAGPVLPGAWLLPVLIGVTCAGELTVVRLRHGEAIEELTLCEAAIIVDVLVLPAREALLAAVVGLALATLIQRRPVVKALFNLGTYTAGVSALTAITHLVSGTPGHVTVRVVAGATLGTGAFAAVNLFCLAQILGHISGVRPGQVVRDQARLSAYIAVGTLATGLPAAVVGLNAPLLLPFMAMPALALTYAYRAAVQEADERARSAVLLRLSHALATRDDVLRQFTVLTREAFNADLAVVALAPTAYTVDSQDPETVATGPVPETLVPYLGVTAPTLVSDRRLLVVPLEGSGCRYGIVALAVRRGRLRTRDVTVLAPLAGALGAALAGGEHLDRLVEETSKLQAIAEQSTEGILMVDGDGIVQMWSQAFTDLTEIPRAEATGRRLHDLLDIPDPQERAALIPVSAYAPKVAAELTVRRPDGEPRRLRLAHSAVFVDGTLVRDVVVASDLTREHRTERLKSDFIATVSHELRTPLTPIIGYLDLLRTKGDRMTERKRQDCLDLLAERARHLSRLVEDLLTVSRAGDGDLALQVSLGSHDPVPLVRQVAADLASPRIALDLPDDPVPVRCDPGRTVQVLANLVGNALKYSDDAVQVRLRGDGNRVDVDVVDGGRGIPSDQTEKVFEKFHRVEDPMTMSTSGTGLGLFIARRLAQAMGGDIGLVTALGTGSTFTLTLDSAHII